MVAGIIILWIVLPVILIPTFTQVVGIFEGTCRWNYKMAKLMVLTGFLTTYLIPLMMMVFFYSRIVYVLRYKVYSTML